MQTIESVYDAKGLGTIADSSLKPFDDFVKAPFSGMPVEAIWNNKTEYYNSKKGVVEEGFAPQSVHYLCLRPFSNNYKNPTDAFLMKLTNKSGRPTVVKKFYDYLFGTHSPWRDAYKSFMLVGKDANDIPDAVLWYDTSNCCSKLAMNFLTAMRLHTCWGLDYIWLKLVDAGFTPNEAVLLCTNFSWAGQDLTISNGPEGKFDENPFTKVALSRLGCSKTDMPFSTNYNPSGFKPLLVGAPSFSGNSLKSGQPVQPNNFIWNADGAEVNADNLSKSSAEYKNSKIKVSKKSTPLYTYLKNGKKLSKDYIDEVVGKLWANELLEV